MQNIVLKVLKQISEDLMILGDKFFYYFLLDAETQHSYTSKGAVVSQMATVTVYTQAKNAIPISKYRCLLELSFFLGFYVSFASFVAYQDGQGSRGLGP